MVINGSVASLQLRSEPAMRGRVMALYSIVALGGTGLGGAIGGLLAEQAGARTSIILGGVAAGVTVLWVSQYMRSRAHSEDEAVASSTSQPDRLVLETTEGSFEPGSLIKKQL
jgi:MFS family permease